MDDRTTTEQQQDHRCGDRGGPTRRTVLATGTAGVAFASVGVPLEAQENATRVPAHSARIAIAFHVNAAEVAAILDPRASLLDVLREDLRLFGTKKGCDHGQCGACTVLVDRRRVAACLTPAVQCDAAEIDTIEGLEIDGVLHPMQRAFIDQDALQCGYCTPGQIMAGIACVREGHAGSRDEIREYMSGNLCRCGAYENIVDAILRARVEMEA